MTRRSCLTAVMACVCLTATAALAEQYFRYTPQPVQTQDKSSEADGVLVKEIPVQRGDTLYDLSRRFNGKGFYYPQILLFNDIKDPNKIYTGDLIKIPLAQNSQETEKPSGISKKSYRVKHKAKTAKKNGRSVTQASARSISKPSGKPKQKNDVAELSLKDLKHLGGSSEVLNPETRRASRSDKKPVSDKTAVAPPPAPIAENRTEQKAQPEQDQTVIASTSGQQTFEKAVKAYRQDNFSAALELFDRFLSENPTSPLAADANLYKAECYLKQSGL